MNLDLELGAITDLAKELLAAGQKHAAATLLKAAIEPLSKAFDDDFLSDIGVAAKAVAKSRGIPFESSVTQRGNVRSTLFKAGNYEVVHSRMGNSVTVELRRTGQGSPRELSLAKAIRAKLQATYAGLNNALLRKTEELMKGDVIDFSAKLKERQSQPAASAPSAPATAAAPAPVIGKLLPPNAHHAAADHHVEHMMHHNEREEFHRNRDNDAIADKHARAADQHYAHALSHAKRFGEGKHWIAFVQGLRAPANPPSDRQTEFIPHEHDRALAGRLVNPSTVAKALPPVVGVATLAKALSRRRAPKTKRALGRKRRTQGVWAERSKLRGKQTQAAVQSRQQTEQSRGRGVLDALTSLLGE